MSVRPAVDVRRDESDAREIPPDLSSERRPVEETKEPDGPAVVLGSGLTGLGVTRCLRRRGIRVLHLSPGPGLMEDSRWYEPVPGGGHDGVEEDPERLAAVLRRHVAAPAVLFPCNDAAVTTVASLDPDVRRRYRATLPSAEVVRALIEKSSLAELARQADVPHPPTVALESEEQIRSLEDGWFDGSLLKPVDSLRFFRTFGLKSFPVDGREAALGGFRRARDRGLEVTLQRYVPGPPSAHLFVDGYRTEDGTTAGLLVRRRERMYPVDVGNSSSTVTVAPGEGEEAVGHLERLLDHAGFHGIFSAEFKEDASDGTTRLLEVNVRPWWYVEFAARCGVDVCGMAYDEALGRPVETARSYDVGRRCLYAYYDLFAGLHELRRGRLSLLEWLASWRGSDRPIFAWDDPVPALLAGWRRVVRVVGRRISVRR